MISSKPLDQNTTSLDSRSLDAIRQAGARDGQSKDGIKAAAKQLESMFLNMMLKSMRQANEALSDGESIDGKDSQFFKDMLDQQYAQAMSKRYGIGLAAKIEEQLDPGRRFRPPGMGADGKPLPFDLQSPKGPSSLPMPADQDFKLPGVSAGGLSLLARPPKSAPPIAGSNLAFIEKIRPHAEKAGRELGVDPRAIMAQAALETGWGKHVMGDGKGNSSNNLFGIKAGEGWKGNTVNIETTEYRQNVPVRESATFRSYASLDETFADYAKFLKSDPRYAEALKTRNAGEWGAALQQAGYATDPAYGKKIADIVNSDEIASVHSNSLAALGGY